MNLGPKLKNHDQAMKTASEKYLDVIVSTRGNIGRQTSYGAHYGRVGMIQIVSALRQA